MHFKHSRYDLLGYVQSPKLYFQIDLASHDSWLVIFPTLANFLVAYIFIFSLSLDLTCAYFRLSACSYLSSETVLAVYKFPLE